MEESELQDSEDRLETFKKQKSKVKTNFIGANRLMPALIDDGLIRTHKWPALSVIGFKAQLVIGRRTGIARSLVQTPFKS